MARCFSTSARRTAGMAAAREAASAISGWRISSDTSCPFSSTRELPGSSSIAAARASCSMRCMSAVSTFRRRAHNATARYMAPVSM